jgi:glucoamylase
MHDGKIFDQPPQTVRRYLVEKRKSEYFGWRFNNKCRSMPQGKKLRLILLEAAEVHWSFNGWAAAQDSKTRDTGLGVYVVDLPAEELKPGYEIVFTFLWLQENRWDGVNYSVLVENG